MAVQDIIGGPVSINVGGVIMSGSGEFTVDIGGPVNTAVMDSEGRLAGVSQEFQPGKFKGKLLNNSTLDVAALKAMVGGQVQLGWPNGKQYLMNPAHQTGTCEINSSKGEIDVEWQGLAQELVGQS